MLDAADKTDAEAKDRAATGSAKNGGRKDPRPKQTLAIRMGRNARHPINRFLARQSLIPTEPIIDPAQVPGIDLSKEEWAAMRDEAAALLAGRDDIPPFGKISPDHRRIASGPQWKSYFFEGYGFRSETNRVQCPQTAAFLDRIPGLVVAFFSIMSGDTHVPRHRGLTKAWLNCHMPLLVPTNPGRCEIDVAGQLYQWHEREWFIFDETFHHEVWNDTGQPRVVLMLQVRRPMRWRGKLVAKLIYEAIRRSRFVQDVRKAIGAKT